MKAFNLLMMLSFLLLPMASHAKGENTFYYSQSRAPVIEVTLEKQKLKLAIDPNLPKAIILNDNTSRKLGYKPKTALIARIIIDDKKIDGNITRKDIIVPNGKKFSTWVVWFPGRNVTDAFNTSAGLDGVIGVGALDNLGSVKLVNQGGGAGNVRPFKFKNKFFPELITTYDGLKFNTAFSLMYPSQIDAVAANYFVSHGQMSDEGETRSAKTLYFDIKKQSRHLKNISLEFLGLKPAYFDVMLKNKQFENLVEDEKIAAEARERGEELVNITELNKKAKKKPFPTIIGSDILNQCGFIEYDFKKSTINLSCY